MPLNVLEARSISAGYPGRLAVQDVTFSVPEGELLGIIGPNGAGKTTLFRAILGLHPYTGTVRLFGQPGASMVPLVGYVPQRVSFEPNFPATVREIVSMGLISERRDRAAQKVLQAAGYGRNRTPGGTSEKIEGALRTAGVEDLAGRRIGELSGGEQQRVFIAKALAKDPALLILDEPVTGVDADTQARFYAAVQKANRERGIATVWSSHDLDAIQKYASRVACMDKNLFFHGSKDEFFSDAEALRTYAESSMQAHMHGHAGCSR